MPNRSITECISRRMWRNWGSRGTRSAKTIGAPPVRIHEDERGRRKFTEDSALRIAWWTVFDIGYSVENLTSVEKVRKYETSGRRIAVMQELKQNVGSNGRTLRERALQGYGRLREFCQLQRGELLDAAQLGLGWAQPLGVS